MTFLPRVNSQSVDTGRLRMHYLSTGSVGSEPVVMIHGNLATSRFFEHIMTDAPDRYRIIAPDMRNFGDTESIPLDATRGLHDWADDTVSLVEALEIEDPVHLVGWSTGGAAIAAYAIDRPSQVSSLTFIDPVSPYGFGGTKDAAGTQINDDFAGTGAGAGNPDFDRLITEGDRTGDSDMSPRNIMNGFYWSPEHRESSEREDVLVDEILKSVVGSGGHPGDVTGSDIWPTFAPGVFGVLNGLSGKYCNWSAITDIDPKPPVLWTHGTADLVVSNVSMWDMGTLGQMGLIPGWPGEGEFPPQPMVDQIASVLAAYAGNGGSVQTEMMEGSGHGPHIDAADRWRELFFDFLAGAKG